MYVKFQPNDYVLKYRRGKLAASGAGLSFCCLGRITSAAVVPISAMDADFIFDEKTADYQNVAVQGQLTYRITEHERIAKLMNFSVDLKTGSYYNDPGSKLSRRLLNIADVLIRKRIGRMELTEAVRADRDIASQVLEELKADGEIKALGLEIMGFSITKISAGAETQRALEARRREEILKDSDDALYERRNASIEQERRVKENELSTEISVEEKKKLIRETEAATKRMLLERESELKLIEVRNAGERERIKLEAEIELEKKRRELADLKLENAKKDADAEAYRISTVMEACGKLGPEVLIALVRAKMDPSRTIAGAIESFAQSGTGIGTLNITPELADSISRLCAK
ncbi:MAG: SPFH domain-containing protein [Clostridia bacterium]|nr:SPFH domain-containing protein [Clostridia bacterium]